jgi:hypothetical protein
VSIAWRQTFQPKTTPWVAHPVWTKIITLGPVVEFQQVNIGGRIATSQAYPVGTGNTVSDKVAWVMDHAKGPFRFGVEQLAGGRQLLVQMSLVTDAAALAVSFPAAGDER